MKKVVYLQQNSKIILIMATLNVTYNARDKHATQMAAIMLASGLFKQENTVNEQYAKVFGKKKNYSDSEIFVFNSMRNAQKILEKYEN